MIIMRSARSPLLKEAGDLSSALTDAAGRLIAQGRDIPIHMGVMGFTVKELLKRVPVKSCAKATSGSSTCPRWAAITCPT